ncbi:hypothetical protein FE257_012230 [Aspergillus nanangensis]|uniref:Terpene synthase n=1 Tax=Aspergillus nanangensis TaxID=2582783 RepID=A0AAD4GQW9_ASPNN|nr:hypothetical protein FE257_012230 [Aspergillus nanangensis]
MAAELYKIGASGIPLQASDLPSSTQEKPLSTKPSEDGLKQQQMRIPDMFTSIMASEPVVNPNYDRVRRESDAWMEKILERSDDWEKYKYIDSSLMGAMWAPTTDVDGLRIVADWILWTGLFDDQFDDGDIGKDPKAAQEETEKLLAIMDEKSPPVRWEENPVWYAFQSVWDRLKKQERCNELHQRYFKGLIMQAKVMHDQREYTRDVQEYMEMRRHTIGAYPAISIVECLMGINLPKEVSAHPSLEEYVVGSLSNPEALTGNSANDICSYKKDLRMGDDHNLIKLLTEQGHSLQEAMDEVGAITNNCYKRWYTALANMDIWGEYIDRQVLAFLDICRDVALGNLHWSFKTSRYLGIEGDKLHDTRVLTLP